MSIFVGVALSRKHHVSRKLFIEELMKTLRVLDKSGEIPRVGNRGVSNTKLLVTLSLVLIDVNKTQGIRPSTG